MPVRVRLAVVNVFSWMVAMVVACWGVVADSRAGTVALALTLALAATTTISTVVHFTLARSVQRCLPPKVAAYLLETSEPDVPDRAPLRVVRQ